MNLKKQLPLRVSPETYDRILRLSYAPHGTIPTSQIVHRALELGLSQLEAQPQAPTPVVPPDAA